MIERILALALLVPLTASAQQHITTPIQTLAFEDIAAPGSDEDHNDVVVRYRRKCTVDGSGLLVRDTVRLAAVAAGAARDSALLYTVPAPALSVVIARQGQADEAVTPDGAGVVVVYADFRDAFFDDPTGFVNTEPGAIALGRTTTIDVTYAPGTEAFVGGSCPIPPLAILGGTGPAIDLGSTIGPNDRPLAGNFTGDWQVPTERTSIAQAYPDFLCSVDGCEGTTTCGPSLWFDCPAPGLTIDRAATLDEDAPVPGFATCSDGVWNQDEDDTDCGGYACPACPTFTGVAPSTGPGGTTLTLSGSGLTASDTASVGGVACAITFVNASTLLCDPVAWIPHSVATDVVLVHGPQTLTRPGAFTRTPTTTILTAEDGSWTPPAGVTSVAYAMWGGGGGGGGVAALHTASGGGGGYSAGTHTVSGGVPYTYSVGAGGPAGTCSVQVRGTAGGTTSMFGHTAGGGGGGRAWGNDADAPGTGGVGETANGSAGNGGNVLGGNAGGPGGGEGGGPASQADGGCNHGQGAGAIPGGGGAGRYGSNTRGGPGARGEIRLTY